ncbi:Flagellin FlaB1 [Phycisphaerales bacterium]|nr:Flagellin FlaB1 [Phycisphaerales bacterium]
MGRINTNVQSLIAQRVLGQNNNSLGVALERLSTGLKINRGKDDPAGLIASENLRSEQKALNQAIGNADRADQVANIAEGGLQEVSSMLTELQGLLTATASKAGLSLEEKNANQLQIDSILQTIDRVASSTNFQGIKLLNGNFDFKVSGVATGVSDYRVNGAKFSGASLNVDVQVTTSAQQAGLFLSMGGSAIDIEQNSSLVLEIAGSKGSRELSFSSGTTLTKIKDAINSFTDVTGVAAVVSGTGIRLQSNDFGSSEFVSVKVIDDAGINSTDNGTGAATRGVYNRLSGAFNTNNTTINSTFVAATNTITDYGQNVKATVNGLQTVSNGKTLRVNSDFLDVEVTLSTSKAQALGNVGSGSNPAFTITGGGADFQLAGKVDIAGKVSMGIQDVAARKLGNSTLGYLDSLASGKTNNVVDGASLSNAQKIVSESIKQVSGLRGRIGAFQKNTVGATIRSLGIAVENTAAAQSVVRDSDFAAETAQLTRSQILVNASTNVLALANQQPQSALSLLG